MNFLAARSSISHGFIGKIVHWLVQKMNINCFQKAYSLKYVIPSTGSSGIYYPPTH